MRRFVSTAGILGVLLIVVGVAGTAHEATAAKPLPRFVDNGDGTITDTQTGLMWEKKTTDGGPQDVNNTYTWSTNLSDPNGTLFTDFLPKMNCLLSEDGNCPFNGKYSDWRIPTIAELRTILLAPFPCGTSPCIDPIFGPTAADTYWSSTSYASPAGAWFVRFSVGSFTVHVLDGTLRVRAVRGGP
jgi:hypothetical protein